MSKENRGCERNDPIDNLFHVQHFSHASRMSELTQFAESERLAAPALVLEGCISETYTRKPTAQVALNTTVNI